MRTERTQRQKESAIAYWTLLDITNNPSIDTQTGKTKGRCKFQSRPYRTLRTQAVETTSGAIPNGTGNETDSSGQLYNPCLGVLGTAVKQVRKQRHTEQVQTQEIIYLQSTNNKGQIPQRMKREISDRWGKSARDLCASAPNNQRCCPGHELQKIDRTHRDNR